MDDDDDDEEEVLEVEEEEWVEQTSVPQSEEISPAVAPLGIKGHQKSQARPSEEVRGSKGTCSGGKKVVNVQWECPVTARSQTLSLGTSVLGRSGKDTMLHMKSNTHHGVLLLSS